MPEEKAISGCCNACELPSSTQVGSTELMEHLEVMESMASRIPLPYTDEDAFCRGEVARSGVGER